jgi:L-methionine (R)-S-oxide reductase
MPDSKRLDNVKSILVQDVSRLAKAKRIAEAIREKGSYRWVGIYDVDIQGGLVSSIAWSGPAAPAHPIFPVTKGLTAAFAGRKTINLVMWQMTQATSPLWITHERKSLFLF